jgi:hypothetical protein
MSDTPAVNRENIDKKLEEFVKTHPKIEIKKVYGGYTEKTLAKRLETHKQQKNPKGCQNMIMIEEPLIVIKIGTNMTLTRYKNRVKDAETHIINKLNEIYDEKCINDKKNDNSIANRGGAGSYHINVGNECKIYIMYE